MKSIPGRGIVVRTGAADRARAALRNLAEIYAEIYQAVRAKSNF